jgi:hypothetical protein
LFPFAHSVCCGFKPIASLKIPRSLHLLGCGVFSFPSPSRLWGFIFLHPSQLWVCASFVYAGARLCAPYAHTTDKDSNIILISRRIYAVCCQKRFCYFEKGGSRRVESNFLFSQSADKHTIAIRIVKIFDK